MNLFIDLETIGASRQDIIDDIASTIKAPGNIKKAETIEKWEKEQKPAAVQKALADTSFSGTVGEIITIGWAVDDNEPQTVYRETLDDSEANMLQAFFDQLMPQLEAHRHTMSPVWVGHYITGFDLRFLFQRCVINKVKPPLEIPYKAKPWDKNVFDTKTEWAGVKSDGFGTLDHVSRALGYEGKGDMDGSKVWQAFKDGKAKEISEYCKDDVMKARNIYNRINFTF